MHCTVLYLRSRTAGNDELHLLLYVQYAISIRYKILLVLKQYSRICVRFQEKRELIAELINN